MTKLYPPYNHCKIITMVVQQLNWLGRLKYGWTKRPTVQSTTRCRVTFTLLILRSSGYSEKVPGQNFSSASNLKASTQINTFYCTSVFHIAVKSRLVLALLLQRLPSFCTAANYQILLALFFLLTTLFY